MTPAQFQFYLVLLTLLLTYPCIYGKNIYENIVSTILKDYDPGLRPISSQQTRIDVNLTFGIIQLLGVGDVTKTIEIVSFMIMNWNDELLHWNPNQYDNITSFRLPHYRVWKPDIILTNTPDLNQGPVMNLASTNVEIHSDGRINNEFTAVYKATCRNMDMTNFPFDHQICYLDFASWTYNMNELDLHFVEYEYDLPYSMTLISNSEWDVAITKNEKLVEIECCPNETYPTLRLHVELRRKPLYFMITLLIPTTITCYISFIGMFSPSSNTGERLDKTFLGITTLLAVSLLMLTVSAQMPVTSTSIPLMGYFLGVYIITIAAAIICTSIIMHLDIYGLTGKPLANWAKIWIVQKLGKCLLVFRSSKNAGEEYEDEIETNGNQIFLKKSLSSVESNSNAHIILGIVQAMLKDHLEIVTKLITEKKQKRIKFKTIRQEWSDLATVLDRACLIFFILWSTIFTGDVTKTIEIIGFVILDWYDEQLRWTPEKYDNITYFHVPHNRVWKPDVILTNTPDLNQGPVMNQASTNVEIRSDGRINNEFTAVYKATCRNMDMTNFPFDHQTCYLDFASWTYNMAELDLNFVEYTYDLPYSMTLIPNSEWDVAITKSEKLVEIECCPNETYPTLRLHVQLRRKPLYFMITLLIPTTITCYISFIGMFSPSSNTGERLDKTFLGITTLLAVSLLMLTVSSQMPVTSTSVPLMGYFLGIYILTIAAAIICTSIIMHLDMHGLSGRPVPNWARLWIIQKMGKYLLVYRPSENSCSKNHDEANFTMETKGNKMSANILSNKAEPTNNAEIILVAVQAMLKSHLEIVTNFVTDMKHNSRSKCKIIRHEWSDLATVLDRVCMIFFMMWSTIFTIIILSRY